MSRRTPASSSTAGYLYVLGAASLWALITPATRYLLESDVRPIEIAFWRVFTAWLLFSVQLAATRTRPRLAPGDIASIAGLGLIGVSGLYVALPKAVEAGGAALASILLYTAPAWVALLSWPLLRERMTARKLVALGLTLMGVTAFGRAGSDGVTASTDALGWGLISGLCYATLYLFGKVLFQRYPPAVVFFWALPVALLVLLPGTAFAAKSASAWIVLIGLGVLSTYGAYLAYGAGLVRLEATRASIAATLEPVLAGLLAFLIWRERFGAVGYLGGALIICAVILIALSGRTEIGARAA